MPRLTQLHGTDDGTDLTARIKANLTFDEWHNAHPEYVARYLAEEAAQKGATPAAVAEAQRSTLSDGEQQRMQQQADALIVRAEVCAALGVTPEQYVAAVQGMPDAAPKSLAQQFGVSVVPGAFDSPADYAARKLSEAATRTPRTQPLPAQSRPAVNRVAEAMGQRVTPGLMETPAEFDARKRAEEAAAPLDRKAAPLENETPRQYADRKLRILREGGDA